MPGIFDNPGTLENTGSIHPRTGLGEFVRVSREGHEWHSFAVATAGSEGPGRYCLVIRRAGDWTERLASDVEHGRAPARLWVRRMRGGML